MKQAAHLPYSSDLAPSDFFLFGYAKGKLMEYRAETPSELLVPIRVIAGGNPAGDLERSFSRMDGAIANFLHFLNAPQHRRELDPLSNSHNTNAWS
jgi:hypothetical protein